MSETDNQSWQELHINHHVTRIVLLPRDPNCLFAFWEISNDLKDSFIREFSKDVWDKSYPALRITNISKSYSFFIRIDDYISSCYINVEDSNNLYSAELGRKTSENFFINMASSNHVYTPSNTVSSNIAAYFVNYKDLKNRVNEINSGSLFESYIYKFHNAFIAGVSSPEMLENDVSRSFMGVSSWTLIR
ncbi:MAG: DUF4912 domain-containing protein [Clostridia bacterium]|nr:DUF4912 domain-containing protein [Clostridia bacterium]